MSKRIPLRVDYDYREEVYRIYWIVDEEESPDDSGNGACIGEPEDPATCDPEMLIANEVARKSEGAEGDRTGAYWWCKFKANTALKDIRNAIRIYHDKMASRPWPDWAEKALAAGWKAPKGWTP